MSNVVDAYSVVILYSETNNPRTSYDVRNSGINHMLNIEEIHAPHMYLITIRGNDRKKAVQKLKEFGTILSHIEYGGYVVSKTYETTEYKGEIKES
jgi:hypothetical protein